MSRPDAAEVERVVAAPRPTVPSRRRGVLWAAAALVLLQAALRGWVGMRGYLTQDDYAFEYRAATMSHGTAHYLLDAWNGHLMPGSFALVWVATRVAPLEVWPTVVMGLVLQAATGFVLLALLRELFGTRKAILVPLALALLTPATLTGFAWWAPALNQLPAMLAMVSTLYLHVRYLRSGNLWTGVLSVLVFLLGLSCFEKLLLFAPLVPLFTVLYAVPGTWWRRLTGALRLHWRLWAVWVVALVPYVLYYRATVNSTVRGGASPTDFLDLLGTSWHGLRATVLGGPWHWAVIGDPTNAVPAVGDVQAAVAWFAVVAVVAGGAVAYRQSARAWLLPVSYFVATAALLATGRGQLGPVIGMAYRYYAEVAPLAALALCLALLPLVGSVAKGELTVLQHRSWVSHLLDRFRPAGEPGAPAWTLSPHSRTVAVRGAVIAVVLSCTLSTVRFDAIWHANPGRPYLATARTELARAPRGLVLADTAVPSRVMSPLFFPDNTLSHFLAPLPRLPRFLGPGQASDSLQILDDSGHLREAYLDGTRNAPGPRAGCGWWADGTTGTVIAMQTPLYDFEWTVRVGYIASADTTAVVSAGRQDVHVHLQAGLHALYLRISGPVPAVRLDGLAPHASVCTDDVRVGSPVALPG